MYSWMQTRKIIVYSRKDVAVWGRRSQSAAPRAAGAEDFRLHFGAEGSKLPFSAPQARKILGYGWYIVPSPKCLSAPQEGPLRYDLLHFAPQARKILRYDLLHFGAEGPKAPLGAAGAQHFMGLPVARGAAGAENSMVWAVAFSAPQAREILSYDLLHFEAEGPKVPLCAAGAEDSRVRAVVGAERPQSAPLRAAGAGNLDV